MESCPHCGGLIIIEELNCGIFRHGIIRETGEQIPPHSSKEEIEKLVIFGCGKPFQFVGGRLVKCDYI